MYAADYYMLRTPRWRVVLGGKVCLLQSFESDAPTLIPVNQAASLNFCV